MKKHQQVGLATSGLLAGPGQPLLRSGDFGRWERELRRSRIVRRVGRFFLDGMSAYGALWVPSVTAQRKR